MSKGCGRGRHGGRRAGAGRPRLYAKEPAAAAEGINLICRVGPALLEIEAEVAAGRRRGAIASAEAGHARRTLIDRWLGKPNQPVSFVKPPDGGDEGQLRLFVEEVRTVGGLDEASIREVLGPAFGGDVPADVVERLRGARG